MDFQDKSLACKDCSKEFTWSAGEQKFYADKGLQNPPSRCKDCRDRAKQDKASRPTYKIICKECNKEGEVPFQPRDPQDVLCADCFAKKRASESSEPKSPVAEQDSSETPVTEA